MVEKRHYNNFDREATEAKEQEEKAEVLDGTHTPPSMPAIQENQTSTMGVHDRVR